MHMFCFFRRKVVVDDLNAQWKTESNTANFNRFTVEYFYSQRLNKLQALFEPSN